MARSAGFLSGLGSMGLSKLLTGLMEAERLRRERAAAQVPPAPARTADSRQVRTVEQSPAEGQVQAEHVADAELRTRIAEEQRGFTEAQRDERAAVDLAAAGAGLWLGRAPVVSARVPAGEQDTLRLRLDHNLRDLPVTEGRVVPRDRSPE